MEVLRLSQCQKFLVPRNKDFHKGNAGHVLIIGGNVGFSGAVCLAATAALRVGAGLVSVATRVEHAAMINIFHPEIMSHGVKNAIDLRPLIARANVIVIGPGLGMDQWASDLLLAAFSSHKPMVVDADALNWLAKYPRRHQEWVLTPHPGEAARMLHCSSGEIQHDRSEAIKHLHQKFGGICVLKGNGSLVLDAENELFICESGNTGMATAGMGDVLSGVIGGFVGQGLSLSNAAKLGVILHAEAGDRAAQHGMRGMIASDLFGHIRELVN